MIIDWRGYVVAAAVGALVAAYVQGLRLDAVRADLRAARDRIAIVDAENRQCAADVYESRKAVQAVKLAAEERAKAADAAVEAAESEAAKSDKRAADLAAAKPATADQCAAADAFTLDYIRGRK